MRGLIERDEVEGRRCRTKCGWKRCRRDFRARRRFRWPFPSLHESHLASRLHETLIARTMDGHLVEYISRDATAIDMRGRRSRRRSRRAAKPLIGSRKRGRPRKARGAGVTTPSSAGTATDDEPSADVGGAEGLRCLLQAQRQGPYHLLDRLWTPPVVARSSLIGSVHAVKVLSSIRPVGATCWTPLACMEIHRNGSIIGYASLRGSRSKSWFSRSRVPNGIVCPYLSSDLHRVDADGFPRFALSGDAGMPGSSPPSASSSPR